MRVPVSDPPDDCELSLRVITGFLFDAAVAATIFLPELAAVFPPLADETDGAGRNSPSDTVGMGDEGLCSTTGAGKVFTAGEATKGATACFFLADGGSGGGGIPEAITAVLADASSSTEMASSYKARGDANRAVGRGPDAEGPLDFFRMECVGCGLEDEGGGPFLLAGEPAPCSGLSCED